MPTPHKIAVVKEVSEKLEKSKVIYVAGYAGMNVAKMTDLRNKLRAADAEFSVVKNNLIRLALKGSDWESAGMDLHGPTALTYGYGEAAGPAKVLRDFAKANNGLPEMKKIGFEEEVFDGEYLATLASLPTRDEALGMLAAVFNAFPASFARVINAVKEKMEEQGAETAASIVGDASAVASEEAPQEPAAEEGAAPADAATE